MSAAWKAAVEAAKERFAGELPVLGLVGDEESMRRFLVGVSGKEVLSSCPPSPHVDRCEKVTVRFFEGVVAGVDIFVLVCGLTVDFIGDFFGEVGVCLETQSGCDVDASAVLRFGSK